MSKQTIPNIELSYRKEKTGYVIYLHDQTDQSITKRCWIKGKRSLEKFPIHSVEFDTDSFVVKHAGWYTILVEYEDHKRAIARIKIKKSRLILIMIPLIAALLAGGGYFYLRHHSFPTKPTSSHHPDDNGKADNGTIGTSTQQQAPRTYIRISSGIIAASGSSGSSGNWYFENPSKDEKGSPQNKILQAVLHLNNANGPVIGETPIMYPGDHITKIQFERAVPNGASSVVAQVNEYVPKSSSGSTASVESGVQYTTDQLDRTGISLWNIKLDVLSGTQSSTTP